ncbi:MAG TPA: molybdopterin-dependent oxidoreductase [Herpetosiphonaceae bacterium]
MQNSDFIMIMGSNFAECHPVGFRWAMKGKARGAKIIHIDPRFTRTSAMANIHAPIRAGSDIVFLGGLINYILSNDKYFRDYVVNYTNAPTLIDTAYQDTEDLDGVFSGLAEDAQGRRYDPTSWKYQTDAPEGQNQPQPEVAEASSFSARVGRLVGGRPRQDLTLQDPNCVFQIMKRHYARYTPEMVEQATGCPQDVFLRVAETITENSGPDRTGTVVYAVGWTQHTVGVQIIRAATILQTLLGNIGRPGGGILALRGHATIQGSTDIPTLYNLLPGYLNTPSALKAHDNLGAYLEAEVTPTAYWSNMPKFMVSLLKAWYGDAATADNDYGYGWQPKIVGDHSHMPMFVHMAEGKMEGFFAMGQNPAVGGQNAGFQRKALAKLKWMVVRDLFETETASFWKDSPEVKGGQLSTADIQTEIFFLPAAAVPEMDGSFTNTQRLVQWHEKAIDPPDDCRSDIWFTVHLGLKLKELYQSSTNPRDDGIKALTWDYIDEEENEQWLIKDEPSATRIVKEVNGYFVDTGKPVRGFGDLKDDGTTACGSWIYSGIFAPDNDNPDGLNRAAAREKGRWVSPKWAFAWPANRHLMYNRASADPAGNPWPKEARLAQEFDPSGQSKGFVWWDPNGETQDAQGNITRGKWVGIEGEIPDFPTTKAPTTAAKPNGVGLDFHSGADPFIMKADGKAWLFAPSGLTDGPLPTHYEPAESPVENSLYKQQNNPVYKRYDVEGNALAQPGDPNYPYVLSTYRLTEHHLSGSMSRWVPWLAELQPELFIEMSPELAQEKGIRNTQFVTVSTPRGSIRAKALVTKRMRPFNINGKIVHQVGMPWHWGYKGIAQGDVVNNLAAMVGDPNVNIHEAKVFVCNVEAAADV